MNCQYSNMSSMPIATFLLTLLICNAVDYIGSQAEEALFALLCEDVGDVKKPVQQPLCTVSRQALSDVTPQILYQQALHAATPRSSLSVVSETSVGSVSSTSHGRAV